MPKTLTKTSTVEIIAWEELSKQEQQLFILASEVRKKAYAPYSRYKVGAAALWESGLNSIGCNIETCTYEALHAERGAIANGVAEYGPSRLIAMAVIGAPETCRLRMPLLLRKQRKFKVMASLVDFENAAVGCGQCLQDILEFSCGEDVILLQPVGVVAIRTTLKSLLPAHFGPEDLGIDPTKLA